MRILLALLLTLFTLPAFADPSAHYGRGPSRELLHASRQLDQAAHGLYGQVRHDRGRSEATSRARDLAEATRDFERLVARNAPPRKLQESFRRVEQRYGRLARHITTPRLLIKRSPIVASLRDVDRAAQHVERALERRHYAYRDDRGYDPRHRPDDRRDPWPYR
ncbi:MAG: hypothetical protein MUC71_02335 [Steroidobacteraceae bacterium]|jgi:hypothetical protein|nr:hypothetical protein [Steroidobacteraceae bacterium]